MMPGRTRTAFVLASLCLGLAATARENGRPRRLKDIDTIVIHAVSGPVCVFGTVQFTRSPKRDDDTEYWQRFMRSEPIADAHFVIGRAGKVLDVIPIDQVANHTVGVNANSIGIELVNAGDGKEPFPKPQIDSLVALIRQLRQKVPGVKPENIVAHSDIDQRTCPCGDRPYRRRQDPGAAFPMDQVRAAVTLPGDKAASPSNLPRLTGPAPSNACL